SGFRRVCDDHGGCPERLARRRKSHDGKPACLQAGRRVRRAYLLRAEGGREDQEPLVGWAKSSGTCSPRGPQTAKTGVKTPLWHGNDFAHAEALFPAPSAADFKFLQRLRQVREGT